MLTARSDGYKCRLFVLLPRVRPDKQIEAKFKSKLNLCWAGRTFFNDNLTSDYLQRTFGVSLFGGKRLFSWDSYRCHISQSTKNKLKELQIDTAVIPGGCTKFIQVVLKHLELFYQIQAADVYWNGPFKARVRRSYEDWMLHGEKTYTKGENMRAPSMEVCLQWIINAWEELPKDLIIRSFKGSGLSNALDGSEDNLIHCFKPDGPIPTGQELLAQTRIQGYEGNVSQFWDEVESFATMENAEYESDASVDFNLDDLHLS